uniref:(northern house mosquito) hypothetical protein n=1 Tax=Culex pipiens TaxID=7175 RepID=A0A8D8BAM9_CULPI
MAEVFLFSPPVSTARVIENTESKSSEESGELTEFLGEVESSCRKMTGSNETYEMMVLHAALVPLCIISKLDIESFSTDLDNLDETNRTEFFPKYCPQLHDSLSCLEPVTAELRKCLDPEEVEVLDVIVNMLPEGLNLACKDNGQIFFMDDSSKCLDKFAGYVKKCAAKVSKTTEAVDLSNYGPKQCNELAEVRECFEQKTAGCKGPRLTDIFDLFYRPILKATPCKSH